MDSDFTTLDSNQALTRHTDIQAKAVASATQATQAAQALPAVNWAAIGQSAPVHLPIEPRQPGDPLPFADVVILTWTSAEWCALDHVFLNSAAPSNPNDYTWKKAWLPYSRGASKYYADPQSGALWGSFQLVQIADQSKRPWRVLLFKSNAHLAHSPWDAGLTAMLRCILADTQADRIYTIGTAGGARLDQRLGDSVITNAALLDLQRPQNTTDPDNGSMYRCPTWFPATALLDQVERSLLYPLDQVVTYDSLENLLEQLKAKHPGDPEVANLILSDLLNDCLRPECLGAPKVQPLKDVPLLTTDFYYISKGDSADAYAFLEMDDALIAREANRVGARFACVRNISDPVIRDFDDSGAPIPETVRADWSGLIYTNFGLQTSYNGALATWATIAGEGCAVYNPPRATLESDDPLEIKLAFQVRSCGTCSFFWPADKFQQPYGPYTAYDFDVSVPYAATPKDGAATSPWVLGRTRPPSFPDGATVTGCRKAPIMTIGINPNMTAFSPGQTGAAWAYPNFSSDDDADTWTKYAWYYRYRSVCQERLTLDFVKKFILPEGQIIAPRSGHIVAADRPNASPAWSVTVRYDGDASDTSIPLPGKTGDFPYMLFFDIYAPNNVFAAGDVIAGRLAVPPGIQTPVMQQQQGYYMQFVPVLQQFEYTLHGAGHPDASLRIGEDVCQLDMVACASPHWNPGFLGGSDDSVNEIIDHCVRQNAWAVKQLVQTRPAVLYVVSVSSWNMFRSVLGAYVHSDPPLPDHPADNDFTLLRATTDPAHPCTIDFDVTIDGQRYTSQTRLVITPHFSYNTNFLQQFRVSPTDWKNLQQTQPDCIAALTAAHGFTVVPPNPKYPNNYIVVQLSADPDEAAASLKWLQGQFPDGYGALQAFYYDPHAMMASVLDDMYNRGALTWTAKDDKTGYLGRAVGACQFCVNQHWQLPYECRYDKTTEPQPSPDFLEKVAAAIIAGSQPALSFDVNAPVFDVRSTYEDTGEQ